MVIFKIVIDMLDTHLTTFSQYVKELDHDFPDFLDFMN